MDWSTKLQEAADHYNGILRKEAELQQQLNEVRESRIQAFGRAQAIQQLFEEHLQEASQAGSQNGNTENKAMQLEKKVVNKKENS